VCGFAQNDSVARRYRFDVLLREGPARFDRIKVGRIGRQIFDASVGSFDQLDDAAIVMRLRVVENDDVAKLELWNEALANPSNESICIRGFEDGAHRDPTRQTHRADHRQARSPIHRARIDELFAATNPGVRATHREIRGGFVEENKP
jgi:hypothetical protein